MAYAEAPHRSEVRYLITALVWLDPTPEDERQAREALLRLLTSETYAWEDKLPAAMLAQVLASALAWLDPTPEDKRQARRMLLKVLSRPTDSLRIAALSTALPRLDLTPENRRQARRTLLKVLAQPNSARWADKLAAVLVLLDATPEDKRQARQALLERLARSTDSDQVNVIAGLAAVLAWLDPTPEDKRQARQALLERLARSVDGWAASMLSDALARLDPTVQDLTAWRAWAAPADHQTIRRSTPRLGSGRVAGGTALVERVLLLTLAGRGHSHPSAPGVDTGWLRSWQPLGPAAHGEMPHIQWQTNVGNRPMRCHSNQDTAGQRLPVPQIRMAQDICQRI